MKNSVANLPHVTRKQLEILMLLYRYRFLNRIQIQAMMGHKNRKTIAVWLSDLREKQYAEWIYSTDFIEKTKPAIYYLGINGVRYVRSTCTCPAEEVRKRYKEATRSRTFIDRSILIADCCINARDSSVDGVTYETVTQADYIAPESPLHFLMELEPHLVFKKQEEASEGLATMHYLLEVFDTTLPRYRLKRRLKVYEEYLEYGEWQRKTKNKRPPIVLFACPTVAELIYAKRRTKKLLENVPDRKKLHIRFATIEEIKKHGVTAEVWEEA